MVLQLIRQPLAITQLGKFAISGLANTMMSLSMVNSLPLFPLASWAAKNAASLELSL
jgi:hypothetical protein